MTPDFLYLLIAEAVSIEEKEAEHKCTGYMPDMSTNCSRDNQPVGPTDEVVTELSSFLGTLARNAIFCPFDIYDWRHMDTKNDLWDYIKLKYDILDVAKGWALERIRDAWRSYGTWLKQDFNDPYDDDEFRIAKRPGHIPKC